MLYWEDHISDRRTKILYGIIEKLKPPDKDMIILNPDGQKNSDKLYLFYRINPVYPVPDTR